MILWEKLPTFCRENITLRGRKSSTLPGAAILDEWERNPLLIGKITLNLRENTLNSQFPPTPNYHHDHGMQLG